jgi:histidinol-phosphate/aromatic aminotransferase/cobyric acid decarboxylase-like protein
MVALSWPNGPAGYVFGIDRLRSLRDLCVARGHLLVIDGCYSGFADGFPNLIDLAGPGCIVIVSWSKMFALAGVRLALVIAEPATAEYLRRHGVEHMVSALALHALERTPDVAGDFEAIWRDIRTERERVREQLLAQDVAAPQSGGNFLHVPLTSSDAADRFVEVTSRRGFRVRHMQQVTDCENRVRFTVGCDTDARQFSDEVLLEALRTAIRR